MDNPRCPVFTYDITDLWRQDTKEGRVQLGTTAQVLNPNVGQPKPMDHFCVTIFGLVDAQDQEGSQRRKTLQATVVGLSLFRVRKSLRTINCYVVC